MNKILAYVNEIRALDPTTDNAKTLSEVVDRMSAGEFMGECIKVLSMGTTIPEHLQMIPGIGFWPVPLYFPLILAHTLFLLEQNIVTLRAKRQWEKAEKLTVARRIFVQIACSQTAVDGEPMSDLSGDHCKVFLADHPQILELPEGAEKELPLWKHCNALLGETSIFRLLSAIGDDEEGSIGEQNSLVENGITVAGRFYRLHTIAEEEHEALARKMTEIIVSEPDWHRDYVIGKLQHRLWYANAVGL